MSRDGYVRPDVLDQNCESRQALELIADKWTALVVYALVDGPRRHGDLRRTIDGISQKMLTQTLRRMEAEGLVDREVLGQVPPHVEYSLTPLGRTLEKPLVAICEWAMEHLPELQRARAGAG
jgi:DNA-binding HxlR family transcriptional regulator